MIHTDLKPENVVISLTRKELQEIKRKGMLTTTKMYDKKSKLIERSVAGAANVVVNNGKIETRGGFDFHTERKAYTDRISQQLGTDRSCCDSNMTRKDKQKLRKNKRKKIKKYIKQGRLPQNYDHLPQDEKDRLYNEIREAVEAENSKKDDYSSMHDARNRSESGTQEETDPEELKMQNDEIDIDATDVNLPTSGAKTTENGKSNSKQAMEKEKQLCFNIPKLQTNLINKDIVANEDEVKTTRRGPKLDEKAHLTIVDMGNGCWTHHHYTSQIQTRQYRSPETIIGVPYGTSADIWSMGCMVFELLTGDFVFEPKRGINYGKDDDHLAQMIELLGPMPKNFALSGKNSRKFFDSTGHLRRIRGLNYWPIDRVLIEKYRFKPEEALPLADFLKETFAWEPEKRASAQTLLDHPWLKMAKNYDFKLGEEEYETMMYEIKQKEEAEKRKKELAIILREGTLPPEVMHKMINSENNSSLAEDEFEKNCADIEDLNHSDFDDEEDSISLGYGDSDNEVEDMFVGGGYGKGKALNNSFTGPYGNMEHIHYDKGQNKQFEAL